MFGLLTWCGADPPFGDQMQLSWMAADDLSLHR